MPRRNVGYRRHICVPKKRHRAYRGSTNYVNLRNNFLGFPEPFRGLRVLSLFDGIGSALVSLQRLGLVVDKYYSSEIDKQCNLILQYNHHDSVTQIGCVTEITAHQLKRMRIDLLIGGSPCNEVSRVNARRQRFLPGSSANLLFEYVRIRNTLQRICAEEQRQFYFLFENTANMDAQCLSIFTESLNCCPKLIDARFYTAMRRRRFFWSNIPDLHSKPAWEPDRFRLQDYLSFGRLAACDILPTITGNVSSEKVDGLFPVIDCSSGARTPLYLTELEHIFGLPIGYIHGPNISNSCRRKLIGRSMAVDVLQDILRPLTLRFRTCLGASNPVPA